MTLIDSITSPQYSRLYDEFLKYRCIKEGGREFITKYLEKRSAEDPEDFITRKKLSYNPAFAKMEVNKVKNAIYENFVTSPDLVRIGGSENMHRVFEGDLGGVDNQGSTLNSFIGREILPELLFLGRVATFVDAPSQESLRVVSPREHPYLYTYKAEKIIAWNEEQTSVILKDSIPEYNLNLVTGYKTQYRHLEQRDDGIHVTIYDSTYKETNHVVLELSRLPVVIFELPESLLKEVADYQIALLNLASADMFYSLMSNVPFYIEQYDPQSMDNIYKKESKEGKTEEVKIGTTRGRRYARPLDSPGFINPSPEPLQASMAKQEQLKLEIREIVHENLLNLTEDSTIEASLAYITAELERGERVIGNIWSDYESLPTNYLVFYPKTYSSQTDEQRLEAAKAYTERLYDTASPSYVIEIKKIIAKILLENRVSQATLANIRREIEESGQLTFDPKHIHKDIEAGILSHSTGAAMRGYDKGEAEVANLEHAERLARIAFYQSDEGVRAAGARGVNDLSGNPRQDARDEKELSRSNDLSGVTITRVRGEANE